MYGDMASLQEEEDKRSSEWYDSLPECDGCGSKIQDGFYWEIEGGTYCTDCAEELFRKEIELF